MITDEAGARAWLAGLPEGDALALERLEHLADLLLQENQQQNLVAAASLPDLWRRHIADSAQLLACAPRETCGAWLDLGSGAGFPGLVIAILRPDLDMVMVEGRARRCDWLERARIALGLDRATVSGTRVERLDSHPFAVISARAFAPLDRLVTLSARFSTAATHWLLPKGRSASQELGQLEGWRHTFHVKQSLTDPDAGIIVGQLLGKSGHKQ